MLEMQMRVRAKEAKRKVEEDETAQNKKRCEREERIAKVQLKAFWTWFPLLSNERQDQDVPVEDESEEELIESKGQDEICSKEPAKWN